MEQSTTKFPRIHIAESVVNRILNINDTLQAGKEMEGIQGSMPDAPPSVPDPTLEGGAINMALAKPTEPVALGGATAPLAGAVAGGGDLLQSLT
jgi:hypothetical protein